MRINDRGPADLALRGLRDIGTIRAKITHDGFGRLWADYFAEAIAVPDKIDMRDFRLTDKGRALAAQLKPWGETRGG